MKREDRAGIIIEELEKLYPDAECQLKYEGIPERLVVATILSAQTTDAAVNKVTPQLWKRYSTMEKLSSADLPHVEEILKTIGLFRNKAKFIVKAAGHMWEFGLRDSIDELVKIPGVGRKTANVVMGEIFGKPAITVDTHVKRLSGRLGLSTNIDPEKIELDLKRIIPEVKQTIFSHRLITHGREVCRARKPFCPVCTLKNICPYHENKREPAKTDSL
ncbi:MAG: endonuclease III [Candidatus Sabulitectum sp.]|nr:endonuclease III [Candidatus Sabulitectum sp.]